MSVVIECTASVLDGNRHRCFRITTTSVRVFSTGLATCVKLRKHSLTDPARPRSVLI
jgi:hypothetical protein